MSNNRSSLAARAAGLARQRVKTASAGAALLLLASMAALPAHGQQAQGMEERLRAQLRATTTQLQQAQNELASLKAGQASPAAGATASAAAPAGDVEALKKELAQSRGQLAAERQSRERQGESAAKIQAEAQAVVEKANAQVAQFRTAYDDLLKLARASEAERQRLGADDAQQTATLAQCESKNLQLYSVGQEILRAYENIDIGEVVASRQPFAAKIRVRYDEIAQKYGDSLYEGRFDARAVRAPAPAQAAPAAAK